jgi:ABC-type lipoprotein release transport system permease subunit
MRRALARQRYLVDFTIASLLRHRGKNLALLVVYVLVVFVVASVMLFSHALRREAEKVLSMAPEIVVQRLVAGRHDLMPATYLEKIRGIRGISERHGRLWGYFYDPVVRANYTIMVPRDRQLAADAIVVGAGLARTRGLGPGDFLSLRSSDGRPFAFRVEEVLSADAELISADLILVGEGTFREFFGIPSGLYTDLALTVRNPREVRTVAQKLSLLLPDTRPILRAEILRTYDALFSWRQGIVLVILAGAILAFVIFAWDKASGLSAEERREIGILKAVGWETADVIGMKLWEGALISLGAFLLGYLLAYMHVFFLDAGVFEPVLKGWAVLYPRFRLVPFVDGLQVATLFFFTVFPYTLATVIPIWRAATTDPDAVMR